MPQVLAPVFTTAASSIFGISATSATAIAIGTIASQLVVGVALTAVAGAVAPKAPKISRSSRGKSQRRSSSGNTSGSSSGSGYTVTASGTVLDHQIIYGSVRCYGARVNDYSSGPDNIYLHRIIAFAGHEIEEFSDFYLDNVKVTVSPTTFTVTSPAKYAGKVKIYTRLGTVGQSAQTSAVINIPKWTTNHRLQGIAYVYMQLNYDVDGFPDGIPELSAQIKGKKVYDPRTGVTAWSDNPALCLRDYLKSNAGINEIDANIDDTFVSAAANLCDSTDTLAGDTRYTCNGSFLTDIKPIDLVQSMLSSMGGLLWYSQGKWRMKAAGYTTPVMSLDENDLRSGIELSTRNSRKDNFNTIKGTFRGPENDWETTDFRSVYSNDSIVADGGQESIADIELPFTDNHREARRISRVILERARQQLVIKANFSLAAMKLQVGDNVLINNTRFGWTDKIFEVANWKLAATKGGDVQISLELKETAPEIFDELDDGAEYENDNTELLDPLYVPDVGLTVTDDLRVVNEQVSAVIIVQVDTDSLYASEYEVEYKLSSESDWQFFGRGSTKLYEVSGVPEGQYDVRVRAINALGIKGSYTESNDVTINPFADAPADVENFSTTVVGTSVFLNWEAVPDLDLSHYIIRFSPDTDETDYSSALTLIRKVSRPATTAVVPSQTGTYFIKAIDKKGIRSENASTSVIHTEVSDVIGLNLIETVTENPDYDGAKVDVEVITDGIGDEVIVLDESLEGTYDFNSIVDLGDKYTSRVTVNVGLRVIDAVNTFDAAEGNFDARQGNFDDSSTSYDGCTVVPQLSTTDDDPTGSPTWTDYEDFIVGDVSARAYRCRVKLLSNDPNLTPAVHSLSFSVDMPDRVISEQGVTFTGNDSIVFASPFYDTVDPAIGLSLTGLETGDYYTITSKDNSGFTITVYDSTDTEVTHSSTLDYVAQGYGKEIT